MEHGCKIRQIHARKLAAISMRVFSLRAQLQVRIKGLLQDDAEYAKRPMMSIVMNIG
jgi:predicted regulator of amino acid metabolism with ACT domain